MKMEYWEMCCRLTSLDKVRNVEIKKTMDTETDELDYATHQFPMRKDYYGTVMSGELVTDR